MDSHRERKAKQWILPFKNVLLEKQELEIESLSSELMLIELEEKWLQWFGYLNRFVRARILKRAFDLIKKRAQ